EKSDFGSEAGPTALLKRMMPGAVYELMELAYNVPAFWRLWRAAKEFAPDVLYERFNLYLLAGLWLARVSRIPFLLEVNAPLAEERERFGGLSLRRVAHACEGWLWRGADRAFPVTGVLAEHLFAKGAIRERAVVIPNGVAPEFLAPAPESVAAKRRLGIKDRLVLGFVGFMRPWHGLDRVIDFIADRGGERLHLLLVGDGPVRPDLEAQAKARGVADRVTFAGLVGRNAIIDHIAAFDVALQPDVVAYASPLKVFEYMALGRAIVAPATPNIREVLSDGVDAVLFDPAEPDGFRSALARLCDDGELRARVGRAAAASVRSRDFTWAGNARRVVESVRPLVDRRGRERA
ncbi:MAG TPA: glycosyltransferase, partial [Candidatus Cybelea sp.]|nr:glycosyltransferase [Candidatus Cybelea sp.]